MPLMGFWLGADDVWLLAYLTRIVYVDFWDCQVCYSHSSHYRVLLFALVKNDLRKVGTLQMLFAGSRRGKMQGQDMVTPCPNTGYFILSSRVP